MTIYALDGISPDLPEEGAYWIAPGACVIGNVKLCTGSWCRITGEGFDGYIRQDRLWGVYPNETIKP